VLHRKEKLVKSVFNLAHFCLEASLACVIFRLLLGPDGAVGPMGRAAALVAVASTTVAGAVAVWLAITATGGAPRGRRFVQLLGFGIAVAVMNGSFGLLAVSVLWSSPEAAWLLIVPGAMTFFAYRLYTSEREKKVRLEFLYRSTRTMQRSSDNELDLPALMSSIREMFGAERAEIVLLPVAPGGRLRRTALWSGRETPVIEELDGDTNETLGRSVLEGHSVVIEPARKGPVDHVWGRDLSRAMIVPLAGEKGVIGGLLVGDRETDAEGFDAADLTLFETLASHLGASLERAGLSAILQRSEERFRSLVQNSSDVITLIEPDTTIKYQTPSIERVLGYEPAALIGTKLIDLVHPDDAARVAALCRRTTRSYAANSVVEWRMRRSDGSYVYAETISSDLLENDAVRGFVLTSRDVTERKVLEDQLRHQAFHDPLTDLANRALFTDRVQHALARRSGSIDSPAILFLDLDDFKAVNDSLGHAAGDALLRAVGRRLRGCIRSEDTAARLGGDEFGILLDGTGGESEAALEVAGRIGSEIALPFAIDGREVVVSASIGIAQGSSSSADASDLLRNADVAMYMAKGRGKSGCEVFDPSAHRALRDRLSLKDDLQRAVADNEFTLRYQPVLDLGTGEVSGVEALILWERPDHGVVSPADFIPLAEETGLVVPMGAWVLEEACAQLASWGGEGLEGKLSMSVNLSARQLQHPDIVEHVKTALSKSGIVPSSLTLEITESVLMDDTEKVLVTLRALKSLGVQLAIDDFGTGYSSLSYLHQFPFDILKIDKAFIGRHGDGSDESPLVRAIVELARTLGLRTVAEGIESREQLDKLQDLRCDFGQGYLFAAPLNAAAAGEFLASRSPSITEIRELQPLA
jgi:diguanylate cyclase (GGDEF)-like protein/PAS domain S-box-containing protein